jgi:hypothetical protein
VCVVTGVVDNGRVPVTLLDPPAALRDSSLLKGFKVKTSNCELLSLQQPLQQQQQQQPPPVQQQHKPENLGELSPLHTVIKAVEVAFFAHATRVSVRSSYA